LVSGYAKSGVFLLGLVPEPLEGRRVGVGPSI
jgi:hypothetical protein